MKKEHSLIKRRVGLIGLIHDAKTMGFNHSLIYNYEEQLIKIIIEIAKDKFLNERRKDATNRE